MFPTIDLERLKEILTQLNTETTCRKGKGDGEKKNKNANNGGSATGLTPSALLVIAGLITETLEVDSVLVDRDQEIQIVLAGSLKLPTQLEQVMSQIGTLPFEQVVQAIIATSSGD